LDWCSCFIVNVVGYAADLVGVLHVVVAALVAVFLHGVAAATTLFGVLHVVAAALVVVFYMLLLLLCGCCYTCLCC